METWRVGYTALVETRVSTEPLCDAVDPGRAGCPVGCREASAARKRREGRRWAFLGVDSTAATPLS